MTTHKYLLNDIADCSHIKNVIKQRFTKFADKIASSDNPQVRLLHHYQKSDWRSTYGRNIMNLCQEAGVEDLSEVDTSLLVVNPIPQGEEWRVNFLSDLLSARDGNHSLISVEEVTVLMNYVCCT